MGRALVLGGGGITGIAWETGMLLGLAEAGVDLTGADVVVGTSAGSVVGAQITSGADLDELYERQLAPPEPGPSAELGRRVELHYALALLRSRGNLERFGRHLGRLAVRAAASGRIPTLDERLTVIADRLTSPEWPERDLRVTVVDATTGAFRVLRRADGVPLRDAVAASCAVPGVYPPVPIEGRDYVDGGARSGANADVARGCERLVVLAPLSRAIGPVRSAQQQAAELGVPHAVVMPDRDALRAIGPNPLAMSARAPAARAGRAQAASHAAEIRAVWHAH